MQDEISNDKKKVLVTHLEAFCSGSNKNLLRLVLSRFYRNSRMSNIQSRFFQRLMMTSAGAFINSFEKWKNLPER